MAEENNDIKKWILLIKDHVNFSGIASQEVHDFYTKLEED